MKIFVANFRGYRTSKFFITAATNVSFSLGGQAGHKATARREKASHLAARQRAIDQQRVEEDASHLAARQLAEEEARQRAIEQQRAEEEARQIAEEEARQRAIDQQRAEEEAIEQQRVEADVSRLESARTMKRVAAEEVARFKAELESAKLSLALPVKEMIRLFKEWLGIKVVFSKGAPVIGLTSLSCSHSSMNTLS